MSGSQDMQDRFTNRIATRDDAPAMARIYNQGIEDRLATFETQPRTAADIEGWFGKLPLVVVTADAGEIIAYAAAFPYADRCCYAAIAEFSVYVRRDWRGRGAGAAAMTALIEASRRQGLWKLLSRIFPENRASLALMARMGFKKIGIHEKHGKLDGVWRDCVIVERIIPENLE
jgi:L-amino acid N-acyltransferase YncA